jgi:hypothetical protein
VFFLPDVEYLFGDSHLTTNIRHRRFGFHLPERVSDLFLGESRLFRGHFLALFKGCQRTTMLYFKAVLKLRDNVTLQ